MGGECIEIVNTKDRLDFPYNFSQRKSVLCHIAAISKEYLF